MEGVLHYQNLLYNLEIIQSELINCYHNDLLADHFKINKTCELIARKYYWPTLCQNVEAYIKGCNDCLASKAVRYKSYDDLQSLLIPMHHWKDFLIDFVISSLISTDLKEDSYNVILVIVDCLTKVIYHKPVKTTIDVAGLVEVIINMVIRHYDLPKLMVSDKDLLFISKF